MVNASEAIILKTIAYGETSLIVSAFTRSQGLQQFMVKGARKHGKRAAGQVTYLQPAAILDLVVDFNENRSLQYIREMKWAYVFEHILVGVIKTSVALFWMELLQKILKQPEVNDELFDFVKDQLIILDGCEPAVTANLPLFFLLKTASILGFDPSDHNGAAQPFFDITEGVFVSYPAAGHEVLDEELSSITRELLMQENAITLYRIKLNNLQRRALIAAYLQFYCIHITDFGTLKSLEVLQEILK